MESDIQTYRIKTRLNQRLVNYGMDKRVSFNDLALAKLQEISKGDQSHAEFYAGSAILDVLQNGRNEVTVKDIESVNLMQSIVLMLGGKDSWDDIRHIARVPTLFPEGIALKRMLSSFDASRTHGANNAMDTKKLPPYALKDQIKYGEDKYLGKQVKIPLRFPPEKSEMNAICAHFIEFVRLKTGIEQKIEDNTQTSWPGDSFGFRYNILNPLPEGKKDTVLERILAGTNYRVFVEHSFDSGATRSNAAIVVISKESGCKHDEKLLCW